MSNDRTDAGSGAAAPGRARRNWPLLAIALLLVAAIGAWATSGTAARQDVLRVGSQKGGTKALMLASGVLEGAPYQVEWSEFPAAQHLLEAIGSGAVDVGLASDAPFQFAYQAGSPIKAVQAQTARPRKRQALAIIVPSRSSLRSIRDLVGKRIATTRGSVGHYLVLRALAAEGLAPSGVRLVFLAPGDAKAAFSTGSIDAWATWNPYLAAAIEERAHILVDGRDYLSGYAFDIASDAAVATKREMLADFLRREARALRWATEQPGRYAEVLARETGLPLGIARFTVDHGQRVAVPLDEDVVAEEHSVVDLFRRAGAIAGTRPIKDGLVPLAEGGNDVR